MNMNDTSEVLRNLATEETKILYTGVDGTSVFAKRTNKICPHDFAVGLRPVGAMEFYPTHVRLLFDLYLKRLSNKEDGAKLFDAIEKIYQGNDPGLYSRDVLKLNFPMKLDKADINLFYTQLLMIEQEFNYGPNGCKHGNVDPPREFLMRFIRWIEWGDAEIDTIVTHAVRNWPPPVKYAVRFKPTV